MVSLIDTGATLSGMQLKTVQRLDSSRHRSQIVQPADLVRVYHSIILMLSVQFEMNECFDHQSSIPYG